MKPPPWPCRSCARTTGTQVIGPGTQLEVKVKAPETVHTVTIAQFQRWVDGVAVSPDELIRRQRVKELLANG